MDLEVGTTRDMGGVRTGKAAESPLDLAIFSFRSSLCGGYVFCQNRLGEPCPEENDGC